MATSERSIPTVLGDIAGNVQEIVRSEVRLARTELQMEANKIKAAVPMLAVGAAGGLVATLFFAWAGVYGLAFVVPMWAAALIVAGILALIGGSALGAGLSKLRQINPPQRTITSMKENVQWAKRQIK